MAEESKFKVGDVVRLRSGGPQMTVMLPGASGLTIDGVERIFCGWFDQNSNYMEANVPKAALVTT